MSAPNQEEDSRPETTYKVGEKKTVDEYAKLDAEDEALARWKASLGVGPSAGGSIGAPGDKRTVVILELALLINDREPVVIDLDKPNAIAELEKTPFTIKEGVHYQMRVKFRVQHELITGLRYQQKVYRKKIKVDDHGQVMGSYAPNTKEKPYYEMTFSEEEAPSGMLFRGNYNAQSTFIDDDKTTHLEFKWNFDIKKSWE